MTMEILTKCRSVLLFVGVYCVGYAAARPGSQFFVVFFGAFGLALFCETLRRDDDHED